MSSCTTTWAPRIKHSTHKMAYCTCWTGTSGSNWNPRDSKISRSNSMSYLPWRNEYLISWSKVNSYIFFLFKLFNIILNVDIYRSWKQRKRSQQTSAHHKHWRGRQSRGCNSGCFHFIWIGVKCIFCFFRCLNSLIYLEIIYFNLLWQLQNSDDMENEIDESLQDYESKINRPILHTISFY